MSVTSAPENTGEDKFSVKVSPSPVEDEITHDRVIELKPITTIDNPLTIKIASNPESKKVLTINLLILPFEFFSFLALASLMFIRTSLFMEKACRTFFKYPASVCANLSADQTKLNAVQQVASNYSLYITVIITVPSVIISALFGGWSNEYLRKGRVLISLFGMILTDVGLLLNSIFIEWPLFYILIFSIPAGLFGGPAISGTYVYSFVSEKFSLEHRTLLYACLKMAAAVGGLGATFFSGQVFKYFGCEGVLVLAVASHSLCFLYILFTKTSKRFADQRFKMLIMELFSISAFLENIRAFTRKRPHSERLQLTLLTVAIVVIVCIESLPTDVLFLFSNKMFSWDFTTYSNICSIAILASIVVILTVTPICTNVLSLKDSTIGIGGTLAHLIEYCLFGLSYTEWIYYVGITIGLFGSFSLLATLSSLSKIVSTDEAGQIFAVAASAESLSPLLEALIATRIYNATIDFFPRFTLIFMAMLLLFPLALFIWTSRSESRKNNTEQKGSLATIISDSSNNNCTL